MIKDERASLVDALAALPTADWDKPSLCAGWSVRDVVAHLISTATMTPPRFFGRLAASGFNFQRLTAKEISRISADRTEDELIASLRSRVATRNAPPGPALSWLGETIVYGEDVFRALHGYRDHPVEHVIAVADFYKNSNLLIGAKNRLAGLGLRATDADWQCGTGPEVSGPAIALLMAMSGRTASLRRPARPGRGGSSRTLRRAPADQTPAGLSRVGLDQVGKSHGQPDARRGPTTGKPRARRQM